MMTIRFTDLFSFSPDKMVSDSIYDNNAVNFWLKKVNPLWSTDTALGRIVARKQVASDMLAFTIRCNRHMQFGHAGQHHPVIIEIEGRRYQRFYSLTRLDRHHVQLCVKIIPSGIVSQWFQTHGQTGEILEFGEPFGEATWANFQSKRIVFLAAGSGITPIYSLLHDVDFKAQWNRYDIELWYWAKQPDEFAFVKALKHWQEQYGNFKLHLRCTQTEKSTPRLNSDDVKQIGAIGFSSVFACGPAGFAQTARTLFADAKQLQIEAFSPMAATASQHLNPNGDAQNATIPLTGTDSTAQFEVVLKRSNRTVHIPGNIPILDALEQAQFKPKYACRMGICNTCVCTKVSGSTQNIDDLSRNSEPNQSLKICINTAQSDLVLDL